MTALKAREIAAFLGRRREGVAVVLVYGPDQGLVRLRAAQIGHQLVKDLNDPFNAIELTEAELDPPARLLDEAAALSFMGGERLIRLRGVGERAAPAVTALLRAVEAGTLKPNALVVIEAGDLRKTSALRKLAEASALAVALPCYAEEGRDLETHIREALLEEGLEPSDEALGLLLERLGTDSGITRSELEKLILYMGPKAIRPAGRLRVTADDVRAGLVESAADATFAVVDLTLAGDLARLSAALASGAQAGMSPLGALRIVQGRLLRFLGAAEAMATGTGMGEAIRALRPPPHFMEEKQLQVQLRHWTASALSLGLAELFETELAAKKTGAPQRLLVERALLRLAMRSGRGRA